MIVNEEYTVNIEKMINEGKGLARINNIPVFVDNVCPGDIVKIKIKKINKSYLLAELIDIVKPSVYRVKPVCALHKICGSCNWQHIDYNEQLNQKQNIVFETLKNITGLEFTVNKTIPSPKVLEYRCKIQYPVTQKDSGRIIAGYYKQSSHELVNIKYCPMQPPLVNEILEFTKNEAQKLKITGYDEKKHKGCLRHIIFRISSDGKNILMIFVINSHQISPELKELSKNIKEKYITVKGICVNFNDKKTNVIMSSKTEKISGDDFYIEELSGIRYKISANSFFQVNPLCGEVIFNIVKKLIYDRINLPSVLDAYSGVSSFGIWLEKIASNVVCVEESGSASNDAIENIKLNNCKNIEIINGDAGKTFEKLKKENRIFDVSVIDPPRKGCSIDAIENVIQLTGKYLIYVSCNVSTLARDMKILMEKNFVPCFIQPVDMFPNTYHVETVVLFEKHK